MEVLARVATCGDDCRIVLIFGIFLDANFGRSSPYICGDEGRFLEKCGDIWQGDTTGAAVDLSRSP
jgi:hypothetical protein